MAQGRMSYTVIVTPEARDGLRKIVEYLEEEVSLQTAKKVRNAILDGVDTLIERPASHGYMNILNDNEDGIKYRRVLVLKGKYVIIYTIVQTKTEVRVVEISRSDRGPEHWEEVKTRR